LRFIGYLDNLGRPFITIYVIFPTLKNEGNVDFLIDTGSDSTVLSGADANLLGIETSALAPVAYTRGIEGTDVPKLGIPATGTLILTADDTKTKELLLPQSEVIQNLALSLLGRDVIQQFKLYLDQRSTYLST
jgi:hypothetical protein